MSEGQSAKGLPTQASLRRLRQFGVRPDHDLGQNFLIDSNILGVIGRAAELSKEDVVLEIGGGLGVLSEHLAPLVGHVHVIELDLHLQAPLLEAIAPFENLSMHWGDAMTIDLSALRPEPNKLVSNLPYGIAAGVILRTIEELPSLDRWVVMVQREVGQRLAACPGGKEYGLTSVIAQLACKVKVLRAVPRTVFHPTPNVDSVLVQLVRFGPAPSEKLRLFVRACFAHRRKTLASSLALSASASTSTSQVFTRERVREVLSGLGHPQDVRAERLSPAELSALAGALDP